MTKKFIYYQEDDMFIGWLGEYPDYKTLMDNLKDIYNELTSVNIPN
jgi:hypothetical protein